MNTHTSQHGEDSNTHENESTARSQLKVRRACVRESGKSRSRQRASHLATLDMRQRKKQSDADRHRDERKAFLNHAPVRIPARSVQPRELPGPTRTGAGREYAHKTMPGRRCGATGQDARDGTGRSTDALRCESIVRGPSVGRGDIWRLGDDGGVGDNPDVLLGGDDILRIVACSTSRT